MPAPIDPALKEAVKAHVIVHGVRPAAEHFGLPVATVGTWSANEGWVKPVPVPATMRPSNGTNSPSVAAQKAKEDYSRKSRIGIGKATAKAATKLASYKAEKILTMTGPLKDLAQTGKAVFPDWQADSPALVSITIGPGHIPDMHQSGPGPVIDLSDI